MCLYATAGCSGSPAIKNLYNDYSEENARNHSGGGDCVTVRIVVPVKDTGTETQILHAGTGRGRQSAKIAKLAAEIKNRTVTCT